MILPATIKLNYLYLPKPNQPMKLFIFFIFLSISSLSFSQHRLGAELGVGFTNLSGDMLPDNRDGIISLAPGVFHEVSFSESFSLKSFVSFQSKGYKLDVTSLPVFDQNDPNFGDGEDLKFASDYLVVSPMAKYSTNGNVQFFVNAGPFLGFLLKDESPANQPSDLGLVAGAGLQLKLGKQRLYFEGRGNWGLSNVFRTALPIETTVRTRAYFLLAGFSTPL